MTIRRNRNALWTTSAAAAALMALAQPVPAMAQAQQYRLEIPATDLATALRTFAAAANQQVVFDSKTVQGQRSVALSGTYTARQALNQLLSGSNMTVETGRSGVLIIHPARGEGDAPDPTEAQSDVDEVVVTGSRIARTGYDQPTPVTVTSAQAIERSGFSNISDVLLRTPQVGVGLGSANSYFNADAGASFINLRGLGTNRTLVLVDGRRRVSGTQLSSAVDLTTIPSNLIGNVQVITGGAAAVYGADAVTGVVNVSLKQDLEGLELSGRGGISSRGDAETYSVGLAYGQQLADGRGSFLIGFSYNKEEPLMANERPFGVNAVDLFGNPANTGPADGIFNSVAISNYRFPNTSYGGAFVIGGTRYTYDGAVRPTRNDQTFNASTGIGGDGFNDADFAPLRNKSEVFASLAHFEYQIADAVRMFGDFQFSKTKTDSGLQPSFDAGNILTIDNPLIPTDVRALMTAAGQTTLSVGRTNFDQGVNHRLVDRDTFTVVGGLEGDVGRFGWSAFYQYGRYEADIRRTHERIQSRYLEAIDVITGPTGAPVCRSLTARAAGCVPLSVFGRNAATPAAIAYFDYTVQTNVVNTQQVGGAQLSGDLMDLPAGPVKLATGVEYRKETLSVDEDPLARARLLQRVIGSSLDADFDVKEVFGEVLVPIISDQPYIKALSVEGALRYSDYSTVGGAVAWKLGGQYAPTEDVRFRVTRSRSVRAPNLAELYSPGTTSSVFILDPCDATRQNLVTSRAANCTTLGLSRTYSDPFANQAKTVITSGNAGLKEEESDSWTVGTVITPRVVPGLSISVDWFQIKIADAINVVPLQRLVDNCVDSASTANPFCPLITRRADGAITSVNVTPINVGKLVAEGVDFQANYATYISDNVRARVALTGSYLSKNQLQVIATDASTLDKNAGEVDNPRWRINLTPGVTVGRFSADWAIRYIGKSKVDVQQSAEGRDDNKVADRLYNDLSVTFAAADDLNVYAGVNNVFDTDPPFSRETVRGDKRGVLFDNIGRYFFLGATSRF